MKTWYDTLLYKTLNLFRIDILSTSYSFTESTMNSWFSFEFLPHYFFTRFVQVFMLAQHNTSTHSNLSTCKRKGEERYLWICQIVLGTRYFLSMWICLSKRGLSGLTTIFSSVKVFFQLASFSLGWFFGVGFASV